MGYETQYHEEEFDTKDEIQFELSYRMLNQSDTEDPNFINYADDQDPQIGVQFLPRYYPDRVIQDKERDIMREKGICLGEYVNDIGAKNREFRVTGKIITPELRDFHQLIDRGDDLDLVCMQWQGEVLIKDSELNGPIGVDVETKHWMYEYQLDLVSTGKDEQHQGDHGIIDRGN